MKQIAVVGSRGFNNFILLNAHLDKMLTPPFRIVTGGAAGADQMAQEYAKDKGQQVLVIYPDYKQHGGTKAPHIRNEQILDEAEGVIAFWDGESRGTRSVIEKAKEKGIRTVVVRV